MLLGILADTHNKLARTRAAVSLLKESGAACLVHCGDLTGAEIVEACSVLPCYFVLGNNDADNVPAIKNSIANLGGTCLDWAGEITLAEKRIAVTHGHMSTDMRRMLASSPDYLFSGHSHIPSDSRIECTRRINPGALHRARQFTVALLDLKADELRFLVVDR